MGTAGMNACRSVFLKRRRHSMRAAAILFTAPDQVAYRSVDVPEPAQGEILVEAIFTCISPGTELRTLAGKQAGIPGWPLIPGYAMIGRVVCAGPATAHTPGELVFCKGTRRADVHLVWGAHLSHAVLPADQVLPVPVGVDPLEAATAKLAAIAYRGMTIAHPLPHETVAVIGLGVIGQLAARLHALNGARVLAVDRSPQRVEIAQRAGIEAFIPHGGLVDAFRQRLPAGADIIVDATGAPAVLAEAIDLAKDVPWDEAPGRSARYLVQGSYPDAMCIPYQSAFRKELKFLISRDEGPRDLRTVLDLMQRGRLRTRDLISAVVPPEHAPEIYRSLNMQSDMLTAAFQWGS
jgi:3-hydroxyethyl bacteriochlorophyllide a dehydrogenase